MQVAFLAAVFFWAFLSALALAVVLALALALVLALPGPVAWGRRFAGFRLGQWLLALQHRGHCRRLHFSAEPWLPAG